MADQWDGLGRYQLIEAKFRDYYDSLFMWALVIYEGTYSEAELVNLLIDFLRNADSWCHQDAIGPYTIEDLEYYQYQFTDFITLKLS